MSEQLDRVVAAPAAAPARGVDRLDLLRVGLLVAGVLCVATGLLPRAEAADNVRRIGPLLVFLGSVIVLAELTRHAGVFDAVAHRLAMLGRGSRAALFALCVVFVSTTTALLNLDTTAVLLTPVLLALARRVDIPALPLAMTTLWLANTASLLLPVSNLTNLLAADRIGLEPRAFAAVMWLPQLVSVAATALCLWLFYWRPGRRTSDHENREASGRGGYTLPEPLPPRTPRQRVLFGVATGACLLFVVAIAVAGSHVEFAAAGAALLVLAAFAILDRSALRWSLLPWRLLVLVVGLFLVVPTLGRHGLSDLVAVLVGDDSGPVGMVRTAFAGLGLSNVANNLPAYTAGEAVIAPDQRDRLLALLIGTNAGAIITPWASLATLLCLEFCRAHGVTVPLRRLVATGAVLAILATGGAVTALAFT